MFLMEHQIIKAISTPKQKALKLNPKPKMNYITVVTFNNTLLPLHQIIKNRWDILKINPNLKDIFQELGIFTYSRLNNIRKLLVNRNILNKNVIQKNLFIKPLIFANHV